MSKGNYELRSVENRPRFLPSKDFIICLECGKFYQKPANLQKHVEDCHSLTPCEFCSQFFSLFELRSHREIHLDLFFRCFMCKDKINFENRKDAEFHCKNVHRGLNVKIIQFIRENGVAKIYDRSSYVVPIEKDPIPVALMYSQEKLPNLTNPWLNKTPRLASQPARFSNGAKSLQLSQPNPKFSVVRQEKQIEPKIAVNAKQSSRTVSASQPFNPWISQEFKSSHSSASSSKAVSVDASKTLRVCNEQQTALPKTTTIADVLQNALIAKPKTLASIIQEGMQSKKSSAELISVSDSDAEDSRPQFNSFAELNKYVATPPNRQSRLPFSTINSNAKKPVALKRKAVGEIDDVRSKSSQDYKSAPRTSSLGNNTTLSVENSSQAATELKRKEFDKTDIVVPKSKPDVNTATISDNLKYSVAPSTQPQTVYMVDLCSQPASFFVCPKCCAIFFNSLCMSDHMARCRGDLLDGRRSFCFCESCKNLHKRKKVVLH